MNHFVQLLLRASKVEDSVPVVSLDQWRFTDTRSPEIDAHHAFVVTSRRNFQIRLFHRPLGYTDRPGGLGPDGYSQDRPG